MFSISIPLSSRGLHRILLEALQLHLIRLDFLKVLVQEGNVSLLYRPKSTQVTVSISFLCVYCMYVCYIRFLGPTLHSRVVLELLHQSLISIKTQHYLPYTL